MNEKNQMQFKDEEAGELLAEDQGNTDIVEEQNNLPPMPVERHTGTSFKSKKIVPAEEEQETCMSSFSQQE